MNKELNYKTKDFWKKKALNLIWERQFDKVFEFRKNNSHNWFLNGKDDVRASFSLEQIATQYDIQGLELDWIGICWDADLRYVNGQWNQHSFIGNKLQNISSMHR